jgi:hypothetical protein
MAVQIRKMKRKRRGVEEKKNQTPSIRRTPQRSKKYWAFFLITFSLVFGFYYINKCLTKARYREAIQGIKARMLVSLFE